MSYLEKLIDSLGGRYSRQLGIDLTGAASRQIFRWFLASKLFGARISSDIAMRTYREFEKNGVTTPQSILSTGWDGLVKILDNGGYARYDFSTATKLLSIMNDLIENYGGDLNALHQKAADERDLERRLKELGKGIGGVTVNIFLRELRGVWPKAKPVLSPLVVLSARHLGIMKQKTVALDALEKFWASNKVSYRDFTDFEAALLRLGKDYCKKSRCNHCPMQLECIYKR
jgi:endonuclease III